MRFFKRAAIPPLDPPVTQSRQSSTPDSAPAAREPQPVGAAAETAAAATTAPTTAAVAVEDRGKASVAAATSGRTEVVAPVGDDDAAAVLPPGQPQVANYGPGGGAKRAAFERGEFDWKSTEEPDDLNVSRETVQLPKPLKPRRIVVANQKGGVGKTTSTVNLAAALAAGGLKVVVLDLDPQGNASTALGIEHHEGVRGTYEVLVDRTPIAELLVASPENASLRVLPATIDLAGAEVRLVAEIGREMRLRHAVDAFLEADPVDYVIIDCPPSLGLLTVNAMVAAHEVLIPIQCEYYALEGVSQLVRTINLLMGNINPDLRVSTVLLTMYDGRTKLSSQVADEVRAHFAAETLETVIPRSVRIAEAPSYGQTVLTYHAASAGAVAYLRAAEDLARRGAIQL